MWWGSSAEIARVWWSARATAARCPIRMAIMTGATILRPVRCFPTANFLRLLAMRCSATRMATMWTQHLILSFLPALVGLVGLGAAGGGGGGVGGRGGG